MDFLTKILNNECYNESTKFEGAREFRLDGHCVIYVIRATPVYDSDSERPDAVSYIIHSLEME